MAIEDYLQYNGQNGSTLNTLTHSTLRHDQLDFFSTNQTSMVKCFKQMPLALRCSSHGSLATHIRTYTLRFLKITPHIFITNICRKES